MLVGQTRLDVQIVTRSARVKQVIFHLQNTLPSSRPFKLEIGGQLKDIGFSSIPQGIISKGELPFWIATKDMIGVTNPNTTTIGTDAVSFGWTGTIPGEGRAALSILFGIGTIPQGVPWPGRIPDQIRPTSPFIRLVPAPSDLDYDFNLYLNDYPITSRIDTTFRLSDSDTSVKGVNLAPITLPGTGLTLKRSVHGNGTEWLQIECEVKNSGDSTRRFDLGIGANVSIGIGSYAQYYLIDGRAWYLYDGLGHRLVFAGRQVSGVTDCSTHWFGGANELSEGLWLEKSSSGGRYVGSSGLAWSWQDQRVGAGETVLLRALWGINSQPPAAPVWPTPPPRPAESESATWFEPAAGGGTPGTPKNNNAGLIAGVVIAVVAVLAIAGVLIYFFVYKPSHESVKDEAAATPADQQDAAP
jgi:hypothetical protein